MDHARKGDAALSTSKYDEAIQHYTDALASNATAVKYYIGRTTAYQRATKYPEALQDADIAVVLAYKRGTRELIRDAQFRRAVALYHLERYADADFAFSLVKEIDPKDKMLPIWSSKVAAKLKDIPEDDERRKVTVLKVPKVEVPSASSVKKAPEAEVSGAAPASRVAATSQEDTAAAPKALVSTPVNKIKFDWYQNNESVTINFLAKGVPKDSANVDMEKDAFFLSFPVSGSDSDYSYNIDPLYASIDPTQSKYRVTPNKVEVTLRKAAVGVKWHNLEGDRKVMVEEEDTPAIPSHVLSGKTAQESGPVYPTSSKSGTKNWDKLVVDDLDDKDMIEGDETSHFFKKLYSDASPEQQRAMMKSYSESGGTVLSTDWSNVGGQTVVPQPPDGMEARKY